MHTLSTGAILFATATILSAVAPLTTNHKPSFGGPPDSLVVTPSYSSIRWSGAALAGTARAAGTVRIVSGLIVTRHQQLEAGSFTIDMRSIAGQGAAKGVVTRTLAGPAWFDVARFPTARFVPTSFSLVGGSTYKVDGTLTLHGITKPASFSADVAWPETGHALMDGTLVLDRRDYDVGPASSGGTEMRVAMHLDVRRRTTLLSWLPGKH